jgi:putative transposase
MLQSVWNWIQRYKLKKVTSKRKKIDKHIVDETLIKVGIEYTCLWDKLEYIKQKYLKR